MDTGDHSTLNLHIGSLWNIRVVDVAGKLWVPWIQVRRDRGGERS